MECLPEIGHGCLCQQNDIRIGADSLCRLYDKLRCMCHITAAHGVERAPCDGADDRNVASGLCAEAADKLCRRLDRRSKRRQHRDLFAVNGRIS